jgi:hypothetical protein
MLTPSAIAVSSRALVTHYYLLPWRPKPEAPERLRWAISEAGAPALWTGRAVEDRAAGIEYLREIEPHAIVEVTMGTTAYRVRDPEGETGSGGVLVALALVTVSLAWAVIRLAA